MTDIQKQNGDQMIEVTSADFDELARHAQSLDIPELEEKDTLVGVPMIIIDAMIKEGDFGPFVKCTALLRDRSQVVFHDGSTGIYQQIIKHLDAGGSLPIYCKKGLRRSDYKNEHGAATTYYLTSGRIRSV